MPRVLAALQCEEAFSNIISLNVISLVGCPGLLPRSHHYLHAPEIG